MRLALQLYTVRAELDLDLDGALAAVGDAGLRYVEAAGLHGRSPEAFRDALDRHGLVAISGHAMPALDGSDLEGVIARARALGHSRLVWPWIGEEWRSDGARFAEALRPLADRLRSEGVGLSYHNHDFEFAGGPDGRFLDALFDAAPWLDAQLDAYWTAYAGEDPALWIKSLAGRVPTVHLKDGRLGGSPEFLAAGEGDLDWDPVLEACRESGVEAGIIELDSYAGPMLDAVRRSAAFFLGKGLEGGR
jgi:sugar phosphate isomerase/epimerase